jgi:cytochrome P450 monooxygenase
MGRSFALSVGAALLLVTYHVLNLLRWRYARSRQMKELGCEEPPKYPHKDHVFGLDLFFDNVKALQNRRFLDSIKENFDKYGQTFEALSLGKIGIHTNDPKNLQAVHALHFSDYGVQPIRRAPALPFLGEGVFTMDGPFWERSRALIRPTFTRSNVANLPAFEVHFQKFLKLIPADGSTLDLQPLLHKLVSDPAT